MNAETRKALLGLVLGFLLVALVFALLYNPVDELPSVAAPPILPPPLSALDGPPAAGETRVIVLGASLTAGYPYAPELAGSYAKMLGVGLRKIHPGQKILCEAWARPALDSSRLVEMTRRALALRPTLLIVTLGSNEFANRVFSGKVLVPANPFDRMAEKLSRSRIFYDSLGQVLHQETGESRARDQQALEKRILQRIFDSAPGKPGLSGLPISRADQDLLIGRLRRSMIRIDELCRESDTPLVFCIANYALGGFWPWGVSAGGRDPQVDELVWLYRQGRREGLLARVEKRLIDKPRRADLHFLRGRLLQEARRFEEARAEFDAARDLDGVPMHLTGEIRSTLVGVAKELSRDCLALDTPLENLGPGGIPPRSYYLDYGHLEESGHAEVALWLADRLRQGGYLPALEKPAGDWREPFRQAIRAWQETGLDAESRRRAPARMASANGAFSMLFGNYRDALPYLVRAFEEGHPATLSEIAVRLSTCLLRLTGQDAVLAKLEPTQRQQVFIRYYEAYQKARLVGNLGELVERLRQGAKLGALENH